MTVRLHRRPGGYWCRIGDREFTIDRNWGDYGCWECAEIINGDAEFIPGSGYTHLRDVRAALEAIAR